MGFFSAHVNSLVKSSDKALVIGLAGGRVSHAPEARWLYSLRLMLLVVKVEILWTTREAVNG